MKKMTIVALATLLSASMAFAAIGVMWGNCGWMVAYGEDPTWDEESQTVLGLGVAENNSVIWQLIFTPDDEIATPDASNVDTYLGSENEMVLDTRTIAQGGNDDWNIYLEQLGGDTLYENLDWTTAGSVYQRIWQGTPSVDADSYYFDSAMLELKLDYSAAAGGQTLDYDPEGAGVAVNQVLPGVPEPATMSLLGLGALAMVIRRKLGK